MVQTTKEEHSFQSHIKGTNLSLRDKAQAFIKDTLVTKIILYKTNKNVVMQAKSKTKSVNSRV